MKRITNLLIILMFVISYSLSAQQDPNYSFYRYNMNIYNPAFAGSSEGVDFILGVRSQWSGVEGAPESQSAIFGMPVGKRVGLGVSILNDRTFIETQTWFAIDFSYHIDLDANNRLYFGIKGSANSYDANTQGLITYGIGQDGTLMDYESRFTPNVGAGAYLKNGRYFLSLSAPKILSPKRLQERNGDAFLGTDRMHAYLSGGYTFFLTNRISMQAIGMLRYVDASPISYEATAIADFNSKFHLGVGYRYDESISALFMFKVGNGFNLGYAYEMATSSELSGLNAGTHELFMRLML
ncbi:type IX secretion system membrane protein PorP/SprF [Maribacter algicola]|uniref:Type IX secretion system membrane protein PorP/SprF n=1 Tax=Meishania litoralis TaxID=3434685 RepID=A0ACC7LI06_9FLAO